MTARNATQVVVPLESLLAAMSDGVLITDENGHRTYGNAALGDLVGAEPLEPMGTDAPPKWLPEDQQNRYSEYITQARAGKINSDIVSLDWKVETSTGQHIGALIKLIPMRNTGDGPTPLMWLIVPDRVVMDAPAGSSTRQHQLEESLRRIANELGRVGMVPSTNGSSATRAALPELDRLSPREAEVLEQLLSGHRVTSIADELEVSEHTVRNHLKSMFRKLGVHSQAELVGLVRTGKRP
jgi:PAS domain S-box-containing protein